MSFLSQWHLFHIYQCINTYCDYVLKKIITTGNQQGHVWQKYIYIYIYRNNVQNLHMSVPLIHLPKKPWSSSTCSMEVFFIDEWCDLATRASWFLLQNNMDIIICITLFKAIKQCFAGLTIFCGIFLIFYMNLRNIP